MPLWRRRARPCRRPPALVPMSGSRGRSGNGCWRRATPCEHCAVSRWSRTRSRLTRVKHGVFYVVMACGLATTVGTGVASWMDRDLPTHWGTFTEQSTSCDPVFSRRRACISTGTWVSDDRKITLHKVTLDGTVPRHGTVRASYKPGGAMGANNVVHVANRTRPELWLPWAFAAVVIVFTVSVRRKWRTRAETQDAGADSAPVG